MKKALIYLSTLAFLDCSGQDPLSVEQKKTGPDLPAPYATKAANNFCKVLGWSGRQPTVPDEFKVQSFGKDYKNPRWIYVLPNGDVLVAETKKEPKGTEKIINSVTGASKAQNKEESGNRIVLLRDKNNDGNPELQEVFLSGLNKPFGMVLIKDKFYVACTDAVWCYPYHDGETTLSAAGKKILELPADGRHWTKNLVASPDGKKLYVAIGSASDAGENGMAAEKLRACIVEFNPDGSGEQVYADGLRNPVGMDWMPGKNTLWTVVNERDMLGDDLVPDYATSVKKGGFYGWPYSYWGQHPEPRIAEKDQRPDLVARAIVPDVDMGPHTASLGFVFYRKGSFPERFHKGAFVGQHGSWNRSQPSGYKVVYIPFKDGKPGKPEDFLTGFMADPEKNEVYGRPVGVAVMADGSLLVADDAGNMIWRVSHEK